VQVLYQCPTDYFFRELLGRYTYQTMQIPASQSPSILDAQVHAFTKFGFPTRYAKSPLFLGGLFFVLDPGEVVRCRLHFDLGYVTGWGTLCIASKLGELIISPESLK